MAQFSIYGDFIWARITPLAGVPSNKSRRHRRCIHRRQWESKIAPFIIGEAWGLMKSRVGDKAASENSFTALDAYAGLRYWNFSGSLRLT